MDKSVREIVKQILADFAGQDRVLTIQRPFLVLLDNDHMAALLLGQCIYWSDRTKDAHGWFAKSYREWLDELGMTERQVRRAAVVLKDWGLETSLRRSMYHDGAATLHYRFDLDMFAERVLTKAQNEGLRNVRTGTDKTAERSFTESTTESMHSSSSSGSEELPERPPVYSAYEQNIGPLTPRIAEVLKEAVEEYSEVWVEDAITEAVKANVRRWNYAEKILRRWKSEGRFAPPPPPTKPANGNGKHASEEKYVWEAVENPPPPPPPTPEEIALNRARLDELRRLAREAQDRAS